MDPHHYGRYAMAGWILVAVIFGSIVEIDKFVLDDVIRKVSEGGAAIALGILAAIVGIGAPPAVGFLLERVVSTVIWLTTGDMWNYRKVKDFFCYMRGAANNNEAYKGPEAFHLCFYAFANAEFIGWHRRRRTQMFASLTSFLAICVGLAIVYISYNRVPTITGWISLLAALILLMHGVRAGCYHKKTISKWSDAFTGKIIIGDLHTDGKDNAKPLQGIPVPISKRRLRTCWRNVRRLTGLHRWRVKK